MVSRLVQEVTMSEFSEKIAFSQARSLASQLFKDCRYTNEEDLASAAELAAEKFNVDAVDLLEYMKADRAIAQGR